MIGAGVTLSQIIKQFKSTSSDAGFSYLTEAARYLENVANLQIRNVSRYHLINLLSKNMEDSIIGVGHAQSSPVFHHLLEFCI